MAILWCNYVIAIVRGESYSTFIAYVQTFIYINNAEKRMNLFSIGYMVNPELHDNKVFREQSYLGMKNNPYLLQESEVFVFKSGHRD